MVSSRAQTRVIETAILVAAVVFFPGVVGYAWAVGWLPVYAVVCDFNKVFGSEINPDGYRVYLLDRGCDVDAAIRNILARSQFAAGRDKVDADRIIAIYHHKRLTTSGDEFLARDLVLQKLREFAMSADDGDSCTADIRYCNTPEALDEHFISRWVHAYSSYVLWQFRYTVMDGADYIASLLRTGPVAQAIIAFCYVAAALLVAGCIVSYIIRHSDVPRKKTKNAHE